MLARLGGFLHLLAIAPADRHREKISAHDAIASLRCRWHAACVDEPNIMDPRYAKCDSAGCGNRVAVLLLSLSTRVTKAMCLACYIREKGWRTIGLLKEAGGSTPSLSASRG